MNILDGKKISLKLKAELKKIVVDLDHKPKLLVIQVGHKKANEIYIKAKQKFAEEIGVLFECITLNEEISTGQLISLIEKLNNDKTVDAIILQLPLPTHLNQFLILDAIDPSKDVEGLTSYHTGLLYQNKQLVSSPTALGIIKLLEAYKINLNGKNILIINRSDLIGKPLMHMLMNKNATISVAHSKTKNLINFTLAADIIIVGVGIPHFIKEDMIKNGVIIIDVGINYVNHKIIGDVDFECVSKKCAYITPVPGGIGPISVACLFDNLTKLTYNNDLRKKDVFSEIKESKMKVHRDN